LKFLGRIASLNFKASGERDLLPPKKAPHPLPRWQGKICSVHNGRNSLQKI